MANLLKLARGADDALLQRGHGGVADLHRQVAARHHDAVGGVEDVFQVLDRLDALDLGHQQRVRAGGVEQAPRQAHVGADLGKDTAT
jgi:hypothetical protein